MQNCFASLHWILPSLGTALELPKNTLAGSKLILPCIFTQYMHEEAHTALCPLLSRCLWKEQSLYFQ